VTGFLQDLDFVSLQHAFPSLEMGISPAIFWPGRATGRWPEFPERRWSEFSEPAAVDEGQTLVVAGVETLAFRELVGL
jgi:hypothetical protein